MTHSDRRVLIIGIDGLRPDTIEPEFMPTVANLCRKGTRFTEFYSTYPSQTRVNMATLTTGTTPGNHGVVANVMYLRGAGENGLVNTANDTHVRAFERQVGEPLVLTPTLGDRLHQRGRRLAVASSSSAGTSLLWNIRHPHRVLNPNATYGNAELMNIHDKLPSAPGRRPASLAQAEWATEALLNMLLDDPYNQATVLWLVEGDTAQHYFGIGSPEATMILKGVDNCVRRVLEALETRGLCENFDLLLISDHGHSSIGPSRSLAEHLETATTTLGLKSTFITAVDSIYTWENSVDFEELVQLTTWLQVQPWCGVVFAGPGAENLSRTLPLEMVWGNVAHRRAPLLTVNPKWSHESNAFGIPGTLEGLTSFTGLKATHGTASPYDMHAFCLGVGPSFPAGKVVNTPCGTMDIAPTVCHLLGLTEEKGFDGRSLVQDAEVEQPLDHEIFDVWAANSSSQTSCLVAGGKHRYFLGSSAASS